MRVLLVNATFGGVSGSGRHVRLLYDFLKNKVDFELWTIETIGCLNIKKLKNASFYLRCKLRRVSEDIDIIHVHNPKFAGLFDEKRKNVLTVHGSYEEELMLQYGPLIKPIVWYIRRNLKKADEITCVDPHVAERTGWTWIPNMIDVSEIKRIPPVEGEPRLLWIGRDDPVKNHALFREVARMAYEELGVKSLALGIPRGRYPEEEWIEYKVVPWSNVIAYLKNAYALVITSKVEGFPTTILEAWASKCPVISPPLPSIVKLNELLGQVIHITGGYDPKEFLSKIRVILDGKAEKIIEKCSLIVKEKFDARVVSEKYLELYRRLLFSS
ncbi:MAG: glycosyltransferase family 4 protein [Candidatus Bathyarchaeia archaeon]